MSIITQCRSCGSHRLDIVLDLGRQPLANALVDPAHADEGEETFPLQVAFCHDCSLVQVTERIDSEILFARDYPYFSSFIPELLDHSRAHALEATERLKLGPDSFVIEIASNDGYLLRNFVEAGIPVLGIDPAAGPAAAAREKGVPTINRFFNAELARQLAEEHRQADLILANNVLAHVDGINDFVAGIPLLLKEEGIAEFEFPYLGDLIEKCAFDTIYHEHVFYYSLAALEKLFGRHGLHLNDVIRLSIHGGSLRLSVGRKAGKSERLRAFQAKEAEMGIGTIDYYRSFAERVTGVRQSLRTLLLDLKAMGARIAAYGAAAKGSTLLNYVGLPRGTLEYVVDRNIHKIGKYMPGLHLLVQQVEMLDMDRPDYLLILAWNFAQEIMRQQSDYALHGHFIVPVPQPRVV